MIIDRLAPLLFVIYPFSFVYIGMKRSLISQYLLLVGSFLVTFKRLNTTKVLLLLCFGALFGCTADEPENATSNREPAVLASAETATDIQVLHRGNGEEPDF